MYFYLIGYSIEYCIRKATERQTTVNSLNQIDYFNLNLCLKIGNTNTVFLRRRFLIPLYLVKKKKPLEK